MPFTNIPAPSTPSILRGSAATPLVTTAATTAESISTAKDRLMLTIFNESNGTLLIKYGGTAANTNGGFDMKIFANSIYEYPGPTLPPNTVISGIWIAPSGTGATLNGSCTVFETV